MPGTPRPEYVYTKQQRIAELARKAPDMAFTTLAHHIDMEWMLSAHARTRRDGAVGVDGQTADEYELNLEANLQTLLDRAKSGTYVAPPVRRAYIPKAGSPNETRPLGIPICRSYCTSLQWSWGLSGETQAHPWALPWSRVRSPRPRATGWLA
jgi:RNA-directed DNA polymerase